MPKGIIVFPFPNFPKGAEGDLPQLMPGIFVEAAGQHAAVPGEDGALPHAEAAVLDGFFQHPTAVACGLITGVTQIGGDEGMAVFVFVYLGGFELQLIYAQLAGQFAEGGNFVLIGSEDEKLEYDMRFARFQSLFPLQQAPEA